jgi:hypothetical protein
VSKYNTSSNNSNTEFSYNTNNNDQQDFNESVNKSLDQTKDNINKSIDESKKQIPRYNDIVNSYLEQTLQSVKEITENYIESQKSIIRSLQSAWRPYQQNVSTTVNSWNSPEAVAGAYSRFVSTFADNTVSALRTTNNIIFSNFDSWKSVLQKAKDSSKQIFNQNVNAAKTFEQNTRELTRAAQDSDSRFNTDNTSSSSSSSSDDSNTTTTTYSTPSSKNTNKKI